MCTTAMLSRPCVRKEQKKKKKKNPIIKMARIFDNSH